MGAVGAQAEDTVVATGDRPRARVAAETRDVDEGAGPEIEATALPNNSSQTSLRRPSAAETRTGAAACTDVWNNSTA